MSDGATSEWPDRCQSKRTSLFCALRRLRGYLRLEARVTWCIADICTVLLGISSAKPPRCAPAQSSAVKCSLRHTCPSLSIPPPPASDSDDSLQIVPDFIRERPGQVYTGGHWSSPSITAVTQRHQPLRPHRAECTEPRSRQHCHLPPATKHLRISAQPALLQRPTTALLAAPARHPDQP